MAAKKVTVKHLQALAGKLNFITRAVPQGWAFSARNVSGIQGLKAEVAYFGDKGIVKGPANVAVFPSAFRGVLTHISPIQPSCGNLHGRIRQPKPGMGGVVR